MINISIDIECNNLEEAKEMLGIIALNIPHGVFSSGCSKEQQESYDGTVFVTDVNDIAG